MLFFIEVDFFCEVEIIFNQSSIFRYQVSDDTKSKEYCSYSKESSWNNERLNISSWPVNCKIKICKAYHSKHSKHKEYTCKRYKESERMIHSVNSEKNRECLVHMLPNVFEKSWWSRRFIGCHRDVINFDFLTSSLY